MLPLQAGYRTIVACCGLALTGCLFSSGADAAQRTFVASHGNDSNSCALTAPCRSFGAAMANTDTKGEIVVLDSAGYGRVTIDRSVSIIAPSGVYAGISVFSGTNGVDIATPGIVVALRGLTINGQGGDIGINFAHGAGLHIDRCVIANMMSYGAHLDTGEVSVVDTALVGNLGGIRVESDSILVIERTRFERNGATGLFVRNGAWVAVTNSVFSGNRGFGGIYALSDDGTSETVVSVTDSTVSQNSAQGFSAYAGGAGSVVHAALARNTIVGNGSSGVVLMATTGTLTATITDNTIARNHSNGGVWATGAGVSATIAGNAISGNSSYGVGQQASAVVKTRSNNVVQDNATDVSGTLTYVSGD